MVSNNMKRLSRKALGNRVKAGRTRAKVARSRGVPKAVMSKARKAGVSSRAIYFKAGKFHVPNKGSDRARKAKTKLRGKTYNAKSGQQEFRGDHNRRTGL